MANITALAIKVLLNTAGVPAAAATLAASVGTITYSAAQANNAMEQTATTTNAAQQAFESANSSAKSWIVGLLGVASAGAVMAGAIKAASDAEQRLNIGQQAEKSAEPVESLAHSYEQLTTAVDRAYETFGTAFAQSADLQKTLDLLRAAVHNVTKFLGFLGTVLGTIVGWFVNTPPVLLALVVAFKALAVVIALVVQYLITRLIVGMVSYLLFGKAMTVWTLAMAAAKITWAIACGAATLAINVLTGAMALLMAVGLPFWAALLVIVGIVVIALAIVVGIVWGLVKAWEALTTDDGMADKIAELDEFQQKLKEVDKDVNQLTDDLQRQIEQARMTDKQKKLDDFRRKAEDGAGVRGETLTAEMVEMYSQMLDRLEHIKAEEEKIEAGAKRGLERFKERQQVLQETVAMQTELNTKVEQLGWTEQEKALDEFVAKLDQANLLTDKQRTAAIAQYEATLAQIAAGENRLKVEKEIADLQKEAARAGMTDAQRKLADLEALGATADQIAQAQAALNKKNAAEENAKLAERGKQLTDSLATPAEKYRQKMAEISKLLARDKITPDTALRAADAAAKELENSLAKNGSGREISSPQALLRGTAEALLAADRQKSPIDKLTEVNKQQLAEQRNLTGLARQHLQAQIDGDQTVDFN